MAGELSTRNIALGQIIVCNGCCCGHTEKGHPPVPLERLKKAWKEGHLNRTIHLTLSGCLGPCDLPNVVQIVGAEVNEWYGHIGADAVYDALIDWARECHARKALLPRPPLLANHAVARFAPSPGGAACGGRSAGA
jgi:cobaltochelatase CobN